MGLEQVRDGASVYKEDGEHSAPERQKLYKTAPDRKTFRSATPNGGSTLCSKYVFNTNELEPV
jgi:hypothetical protein